MQLDLKLCVGKYKRSTDPQPKGADCKSAPAASNNVCTYPEEQGIWAPNGTKVNPYDIYPALYNIPHR
ncbi:MAG TPA: hypothetical protein DHV48_19335 [Prolixibacteraceae bacterium]|nr:hypothetical protein [Prolixibacteraceae bacterium]